MKLTTRSVTLPSHQKKMTGERILRRVLSLCMALMAWTSPLGAKAGPVTCPWEEKDLYLWSDPATWDSGIVPQDNDEVSVTKRVLLDTQPSSLANLTIQPGAALIWGNVPDLVLRATYIRVLGEFHIGSDACRFQQKATIKLYGTADSPYEVEHFGRKFLGVGSGGALELHGADKMSWSKLAHTVYAFSPDINCSFVYDHKTATYGAETLSGVHMIIWNQDGTVFDFEIFDSTNWNTLPTFLDVPDGLVVAASVRKDLGVPTATFYDTMESLGAQSIRDVAPTQMYAFIVKKGDISTAAERLADVDEPDTGYLHFPDYVRDLDFSVTSTSSDVDFRVLNGDVAFPIISVAHDVSSWQPGDEVVVTSSDYDWRQAEVRRVLACSTCTASQIRLDAPFQNMHYGEVTQHVDERAEVALLTRNILVVGELEESCYGDQTLCNLFERDTFGGHAKALRGSTVHIQGVELQHLGQQHSIAAYPFHFHMMDDASGMWFRNNSIHHSLSRCVTIHGTDNAEVSDNVCYDHLGHGYFLEDSVEQNNTLNRNLGVGTQHGALLMSDRAGSWCEADGLVEYCDAVSTFWITHPNNEVINNVAAGSDRHGFMYVFADKPLGDSAERQQVLGKVLPYSLRHIPVKRFYNNVAHSNVKSGLFFDHKISTNEMHRDKLIPENGILPVQPEYDPRSPPDASGARVWTTMERGNFYKNMKQNVWVKPGNVRMTRFTFADSLQGYGGGNAGTNTGAEVKDSVFVGRTDNKGMPDLWTDWSHPDTPSHQFDHSLAGSPYEPVTGVGFYQGPLFIDNCYFDRYYHDVWANDWLQLYGTNGVTYSGAISWARRNAYPSTPFSSVRGLKFGYCDDQNGGNWAMVGNSSMSRWDWNRDGTKQATVRDEDGSLTGQAGTQLVQNRPFFTGPQCRDHDNWGLTACPYRYIQMEVTGNDGVLNVDKKKKFPLILRRDDVPSDQLMLQGEQKNTFLLRTHKSYTVSFNQTFGSGSVPTFISVEGYWLEAGDVVRIALCIPKDTTDFKIRSDYPPITYQQPPVWATSLQQLDNDTAGNMFFWDNNNGLLYFKLMTTQTRQNGSQLCSGEQCIRFKIWRLDGGTDPIDCSSYSNPPMADNTPVPDVPEPVACSGPASPDGLGALDPAEIVTADPVPVTCKNFDDVIGRGAIQFEGCFKDKPWAEPAMTEREQVLPKSLTRPYCVDRCYRRGYQYAGLKLGKICMCGNGGHNMYGPAGASYPCDTPCSGDTAFTCGGSTKKSLEVWNTGYVPPSA